MFPTTPTAAAAAALVRPRLRETASWIRDDLDPVIAREGPDHLRPDDVLTLHDIFQALLSSTITALDLRATGIHRAVMEVAGTATRWPSRLVDSCDKVITVWTAKFGRLDALHPFMHGRGGRLEGIALAEEFSRATLLQRWRTNCPEKIAPSISHRCGDLGFKAGSWWLTPLFAHHAGIIDLQSADGGVCFDKHSAYAIVLKDLGELDATSPTSFTYRCPPAEKGRFRLTAATPKSRGPIRVLRSHTLNSIWGPKVGVRYEGLHRVAGWSIHQAKPSDIIGLDLKVGDIIYDIKFERVDDTPMEEVMKRPTACESDDYLEYKRLRRVLRESYSKIAGSHATQGIIKTAPPVSQLQAGPITPSRSPSRTPPKARSSTARSSTMAIEAPPFRDIPSTDNTMILRAPSSMSDIGEVSAASSKVALDVTVQTIRRPTVPRKHSDLLQLHTLPQKESNSMISSNLTTTSTGAPEIKEVAPWIDFEPEVAISHTPQASSTLSRKSKQRMQQSNANLSTHSISRSSANSAGRSARKERNDVKNQELDPSSSMPLPGIANKGGRLSVFARSANPLAKIFDGAEDAVSYRDDYFNFKPTSRAGSVRLDAVSPMVPRLLRPSSSDSGIYPLSPVPFRPLSPLSPLAAGRRDAICFPFSFAPTPDGAHFVPAASTTDSPFAEYIESAQHPIFLNSIVDPFIDTAPERPRRSMPVSLKNFISKPRTAAPISSSALTSGLGCQDESDMSGVDSLATYRLRKMVSEKKHAEVRVEVKDPFSGNSTATRRTSGASSGPDITI